MMSHNTTAPTIEASQNYDNADPEVAAFVSEKASNEDTVGGVDKPVPTSGPRSSSRRSFRTAPT